MRNGFLSGKRILVVEDDYLLAVEAERALRDQGAEIVGPVSGATAAIAATFDASLSAALVDIDLGDGPCYRTAEALRGAGVPFVFLTGYDQAAIASPFANIMRFEKPVSFVRLVNVLADLSAARP